ncbi:MAG: hypothetical protein H0T42_04715 [Deltaproteobacteria bacterium]|nr:hypothetical protein [Deltaproteobacteria bacterium]
MRLLSLVIFAAACGGSSKSAEPQQPRPAPEVAPEPAPPPPPVKTELPPPPPPKPEKPPAPSIYDRLNDNDGAVVGLAGYSTRRVRDPKRCGGLSILVKKGKKVAPSDARIAAVFALEFPVGLEFSETKKAGSLLKFNAWIETFTKTMQDANTHYQSQFSSTDLAVKAAATARLAQTNLRAASVLARAEVPADIRAMDDVDVATAAYCDAIAERAEALLALGLQALDACQKHTLAAPAGWWADLCKAP